MLPVWTETITHSWKLNQLTNMFLHLFKVFWTSCSLITSQLSDLLWGQQVWGHIQLSSDLSVHSPSQYTRRKKVSKINKDYDSESQRQDKEGRAYLFRSNSQKCCLSSLVSDFKKLLFSYLTHIHTILSFETSLEFLVTELGSLRQALVLNSLMSFLTSLLNPASNTASVWSIFPSGLFLGTGGWQKVVWSCFLFWVGRNPRNWVKPG